MKLSFTPAEDGSNNAVISPDDWKGAPHECYFTLIGAGTIEQQNELAAKLVERFNAAEPRSPSPNQGEGQ